MPKPSRSIKGRIWLLDRREYWRKWSRQVLERAGLSVKSWGDYAFPPVGEVSQRDKPDLVMLACTTVGDEELDLVQRAASSSLRVLVLASWIPESSMRAFFLAGAYDVSAMPAQGQALVELMEGVLAEAPSHSSFEPLVPARAER